MRTMRWAAVGLLLVACSEGAEPDPEDAGEAEDAASADTGPRVDAGPADGGARDAAVFDAALADAQVDAGAPDAQVHDAGTPDAGFPADPLVGIGAVESVQGGFLFTEGPQWWRGGLYFSDLHAGIIYVHTPGAGVEVYRSPSGDSNGLAVDAQGRLLAAEHENRRVSVTEAGGAVSTVVDSYQGQRLNSPNDLVVRSDGNLYFTDPHWGIFEDPGLRELSFNGVFRRAPDGSLSVVWSDPWTGHDTTARPNGIVLSPDERTLYVADDRWARVLRFDVAPDGSTSGEALFVDTGAVPDGMAMDQAGNLYVATHPGVEVFGPDGTRHGVITVPEPSANVAFGGDDARTLYITARTSLYRVRMVIPGLR